MGSDNLVGADNQQERLSSEERRRWFIAGLVEGEGSVTLSIKMHPARRFGCYLQPEFFIYQHRDRRELLEMAQEFFQAGRIRPKPGNPDVLVFSIVARRDIAGRVVPFLRRCLEFSARRDDFVKFIVAVTLLEIGAHKRPDGVRVLVELAYSMNQNGKQRRLPIDQVLDRILRGHTPNTSEPK